MEDGGGIEFMNKIRGSDKFKHYQNRVAGAACILLTPCTSGHLAKAISDVVGFTVGC